MSLILVDVVWWLVRLTLPLCSLHCFTSGCTALLDWWVQGKAPNDTRFNRLARHCTGPNIFKIFAWVETFHHHPPSKYLSLFKWWMIRDFVCLFQDWNLRGERSQSGSGQPARDVSEEPRFVATVNGLRQVVFLDRGWTSPWLDQGKLSKDFSEANAMVVKCGKNQLIIVDHSVRRLILTDGRTALWFVEGIACDGPTLLVQIVELCLNSWYLHRKCSSGLLSWILLQDIEKDIEILKQWKKEGAPKSSVDFSAKGNM